MPSLMTLRTAIVDDLKKIVGEKNVLTQPGDLALYSYDSALDKATPSAVVLPKSPDQVSLIVNLLFRNKIPYVARGAATSLCGGPVPLQNAVVIGLARLKRIGNVDKNKNEISVEPGVINLHLQDTAAAQGLFYPPDPGSQKACTIGGNVATNAGGPHCLKYGVTSNYVVGLEMVLPDGKQLPMNIDEPGYDLPGFFVGSEGTLGIATKIRLKLLPKPAHIRTMLVSFPSIEDAIQAVTDIISAGVLPATLEAMDKTIVQAVEEFIHAGYPTEAEAVLLIEVDGAESAALDDQVSKIKSVCEKNKSQEFRFAQSEEERKKLWEGRRGSYAAMARLAPNVLVEDGAVPRTRLPEALAAMKTIAAQAGLRVAFLFHAGDGNLHPQIIFDERDKELTKKVKEAGYKMLKACVDLGGTISGEHGIGIDKREAMKWLFTRDTLSLFRRLKQVFDPDNLCNPDKLIPLIGRAAVEKKEAPNLADDTLQTTPVLAPADEAELTRLVKELSGRKTYFGVQGSGSKYGVKENMMLHTTKLNKILDFDKGNLTLTVQCGVPVEEARKTVEAAGQFLWVAGGGTIGGAVATRASAEPPLREIILGMRLLLPTGEMVQLGAKTMKNVAGYDVPKLLIGSWGTLAIILDVTFRLFPTAASKLVSKEVRPFIFKDIHKRIKAAFDPDSLLNNRLLLLMQADIDRAPKGVNAGTSAEEDVMKKLADKFWT